MTAPIRVFVADDHAVVRAGLCALIEKQEDMCVVGQARDGRDAVTQVAKAAPDVILIDIEMPEHDGLTGIKLLTNVAPNARCVALTMYQDRAHIRAVLEAGGAAFVAKSVADVELLQVIRNVHQGSSFACVVEGSSDDLVEEVRSGALVQLSRREREVLRLLALGHTNREIAEKMSVGIKSVETYRSRTMKKLGTRTRADLVQYALKTGLLS